MFKSEFTHLRMTKLHAKWNLLIFLVLLSKSSLCTDTVHLQLSGTILTRFQDIMHDIILKSGQQVMQQGYNRPQAGLVLDVVLGH